MDNKLSPTPPVVVAEVEETMDFYQALHEIAKGNWVTRLSWEPGNDEYCLMLEGFLSIRRDGTYHQWIISDGDMEGTDWIVING